MIFLDAGGTLIEVRTSVGEIYSRIALAHGIQRRPEELQNAFQRCFPAQPPMAFSPEVSITELKRLEFYWWRSLVRDVFDEATPSTALDDCFHELFTFFGTAASWRIFPDVAPALNRLKDYGIKFAIISNFDSRLESLLDGLGLSEYFEAVHISTRVGAAKPDPQIFRAALLHHGLAPEEAWHVGDSLREDAEGALGAGMQGIWLDRKNVGKERVRHGRITGLDQLIDLM